MHFVSKLRSTMNKSSQRRNIFEFVHVRNMCASTSIITVHPPPPGGGFSHWHSVGRLTLRLWISLLVSFPPALFGGMTNVNACVEPIRLSCPKHCGSLRICTDFSTAKIFFEKDVLFGPSDRRFRPVIDVFIGSNKYSNLITHIILISFV